MSGSDSPTFFHGQPWSSWIEKIGRDKPLSDGEPDSEPSSSVMRLSVDDIDLFGFCPERDNFYGVVCEICNSIVKPQALIQHMESRHPSGTSNLPPPTNSTAKPIMKTPYCKLSKLKKSQSSGQLLLTNNNSSNNGSGNGTSSKTSNNHTPVKHRTGGNESQPQPSLHPSNSPRSPLDGTPASNSINNGGPTIPSAGQLGAPTSAIAAAVGGFSNALSGTTSAASPVKSPGNQPKRKRLKTDRSLLKDREYDPDRHCGVWNEETSKPCTRSLTCKAHTVSLRRTVTGRSKSFDKLLADHRASKESPASRNATSSNPSKAVAVSSSAVTAASNSINNNNNNNAPSSPPVLSLPDTYPLPQAVDLLYRCLAPHGSNKPTKLEEDFANELDPSRRIDSNINSGNVNNTSSSNSSAAMAPISVVLPSLSPIQSSMGGLSPSQAASLMQYNRTSSPTLNLEQMIVKQQSPVSISVVPCSGSLLISNQSTPVGNVVLEAKPAPMDIDQPASSQNFGNSSMYMSPVHQYKDTIVNKVNMHSSQSPSSRSSSFSSLFDTSATSLLDQQHYNSLDTSMRSNHFAASILTNGKQQRLSNNHMGFQINTSSSPSLVRGIKSEYTQDYSTAIQLEATAASTPYAATSFEDITWSSHHPEPLAVSKWLRITSSRKQYNFNIH
ncbi:ataxin-7-like [Copidosoma floridanum]|uniref:ataxin-7-like n=1 Tax=Copidosoma floridanum TaxID=29053 RepID=UPI000C6FC287|nr:ataxin-7-like [Copidosoma floridanum]